MLYEKSYYMNIFYEMLFILNTNVSQKEKILTVRSDWLSSSNKTSIDEIVIELPGDKESFK